MKSRDTYDDIINLPHHTSATRPHMALADRAAQFAPFAALNGHSAIISRTAESHIADVNTPHFETDMLLNLLSDHDYSDL